MKASPTAESVRSLELMVDQHLTAIQRTKADLATIQRRIVSLKGWLLFLKLSKSVRKFVDGTIVWRHGAILIVGTAIAGIGIVSFRSPVFGVVGGILAVVTMVFIVLYPSDAKWTENAVRLNKELADLQLKVPGMVTHLQELKCVRQSDSDKLTNQRLALECEQFAVSHERRGKELLDLRCEELPPSPPPVPPVDMMQLAASLFISLSTMGCGCAMMLFFGILLVLLLMLVL